jgi:hypothetical protein
MSTKICTKCRIRKSVELFFKRPNVPDGRRSWCSRCEMADTTKYRHKYPKKHSVYNTKYRRQFPWVKTFTSIRSRCNTKSDKSYRWYGKRGIQNKLTVNNIKYLWYRDQAYLMKKPSIDRKDPDKNYTLSNCRFIEHVENCKLAHRYCRHCKGTCKIRSYND